MPLWNKLFSKTATIAPVALAASSFINIAVQNHSTVVSDADLQKAIPAFQTQITRDFAPIWGINATLTYYKSTDTPPASDWLIGVFDDADQAGALGYHDLTSTGLPMGKVFAKTTITDGGKWTVTFSHELLEMIVDPCIDLSSFDQSAGRLYCYELCDAVEDDSLGYDIDGTTVSDFVTPQWFESGATAGKFAFKSAVPGPFHLLSGGYIGYYDINGGTGWQQLTAREGPINAKTAMATPGFVAPAGSRRELRTKTKDKWKISTNGNT